MKSSRSILRRLVRNIATFYNQSQSSCRVLVGVLCWPMLIAFTNSRKLSAITITCLIGFATAARADEGMWLFSAPPLKQLKEKYQFEPTSQWLEHLQKASVRFNSGGSGTRQRDCGDRKGKQREEWPAFRCDHALSRRRISSLSLQTL